MATRTKFICNLTNAYISSLLEGTIGSTNEVNLTELLVWWKLKPVFSQAMLGELCITVKDHILSVEWDSKEYLGSWESMSNNLLSALDSCVGKDDSLKYVGKPIIKAVRTNAREYNAEGKIIYQGNRWVYTVEVFIRGFEDEAML